MRAWFCDRSCTKNIRGSMTLQVRAHSYTPGRASATPGCWSCLSHPTTFVLFRPRRICLGQKTARARGLDRHRLFVNRAIMVPYHGRRGKRQLILRPQSNMPSFFAKFFSPSDRSPPPTLRNFGGVLRDSPVRVGEWKVFLKVYARRGREVREIFFDRYAWLGT